MPALLSIDPGIGSTGWAFWSRDNRLVPSAVGLIQTKVRGEWWERAVAQAFELCQAIPTHKDLEVVCEFPIFWSGTAGGVAAAETGSLLKLCYMVGVLGDAINRTCVRTSFAPIAVRDWKGQLPKHVVMTRIMGILGPQNCQDFKQDIWDAVGIGLYKKGAFK